MLSIDKEEIQKLKNELDLVKNKLNQSNSNQKSQLESKLSNIEGKIKILTNQDKSVIRELEKAIKEVKEKIKNDKPDDNTNPGDRKEGKFEYRYHSNEKGVESRVFENIFPDSSKKDWRFLWISQNHPQIKKLLDQGKLQKFKLFTIRYGKVDKISNDGITYTFNESNQELEIIEI